MANEPDPIRRFNATLREGESLPVDDTLIVLRRARGGRAEVTIEASRDIPIGQVRRADEQPGGGTE